MERGKEEFSDTRVTLFLIAAILISIAATLTVIINLYEMNSGDSVSTEITTIPRDSTGTLSFTINEIEEVNGTG